MKKSAAIILGSAFIGITGCAMLTSWQAIPPPGGCDQCHSVPITNNWHVAYQAPMLNDEKDRKYFQSERYNMPSADKPASKLEVRKLQDEKCFECHRSPSPSHKGRMGRFHH
jgi:hypothetical protein